MNLINKHFFKSIKNKLFIFNLFVVTSFSVHCAPEDEFVTKWKTDNPGASSSTSIRIPTQGGGYMYDVDWDNDGNFDEFGLTGSTNHDYGVAGEYIVRI